MTDIFSIGAAIAPLAILVAFPIALAWALDPAAIPGRGRATDAYPPVVPEPEPVRWRTELAGRRHAAGPDAGAPGTGRPARVPTGASG